MYAVCDLFATDNERMTATALHRTTQIDSRVTCL